MVTDPPSGAVLPTFPEATRRGLARNVLRNTLRLSRGENLLVETWSATMDWAESFVLEGRALGAKPMLVVEDEATYWESLREGVGSTMGRVGSHDWAALKASNAHVYLYGPFDTAAEERLPSAVVRRIEADDHEWFRIVAKYGIRSARWDLGRTSEISARRYGVNVDRWRQELVEAASVDPHGLRRDGLKIAHALKTGKELRITHPNGTDLRFRLAGRRPRLDDGMIDEEDVRSGNVFSVLPSGVVSATVDETWAEGTFVGDVTGVLLASGREVPLSGGHLEFRGGRLTKYAFETGQAEFRKEFVRATAGKARPALVSVGLNPGIHAIPLLFDQEKGVVTIAVGRNSYLGGATKTPRFTAYQSVRDASLSVDGDTLVDGGKFL